MKASLVLNRALDDTDGIVNSLESQQNTEHRQIVVGNQIDDSRKHHQIQWEVIFEFFLSRQFFLLPQEVVELSAVVVFVFRHKNTPLLYKYPSLY